VKTLAENISTAAGRLTYPSEKGGRSTTPKPDQIKPKTAGTAITNPKADAVPTARCTGNDIIDKIGTDSVPPPIPIRAENPPIPVPVNPRTPVVSGGCSARIICRGKIMFIDTNKATKPNIAVSIELSNALDNTPPIAAPAKINGAQDLNRASSIAPFL